MMSHTWCQSWQITHYYMNLPQQWSHWHHAHNMIDSQVIMLGYLKMFYLTLPTLDVIIYSLPYTIKLSLLGVNYVFFGSPLETNWPWMPMKMTAFCYTGNIVSSMCFNWQACDHKRYMSEPIFLCDIQLINQKENLGSLMSLWPWLHIQLGRSVWQLTDVVCTIYHI